MNEINVTGFGMLPCLHCGKIFKLSGEIHICDKKLNWLKQQKVFKVLMSDGTVMDLKPSQKTGESK